MVSLLDIIGPVMVGPSSSHTAGACRIGLLARGLVRGTPESARAELHGSFARTGEGHGTDKAIVGGLMGFRPDDERLRTALDIMEREELDYTFEKTTLGDDNVVHPNTVRITVTRNNRTAVMQGSSLGAGRVLVTEIDGYPVEVTGNLHTIVLVAEDVKGSVARIASSHAGCQRCATSRKQVTASTVSVMRVVLRRAGQTKNAASIQKMT